MEFKAKILLKTIEFPYRGQQVCFINNYGNWCLSNIKDIVKLDNGNQNILIADEYGEMFTLNLSELRLIWVEYNNCCGRCDGIDDICDGKILYSPINLTQWVGVLDTKDFENKTFIINKKFDSEIVDIVWRKPRMYTIEDMQKAYQAGWNSRMPTFDGGWETIGSFKEFINETFSEN